MKLEAIVLAAGAGSRMVELTRGRPKCLLPVGNQCLIWYAITGLRLVGVTRIIVLVPDIHENDIKQYCHKKFNSFKNLTLEYAVVPTKNDCGTAQSIHEIADRIREDFIVHSCDTIIDPKALSALVNHYRLYDPTLSMLLSDNPKYFLTRTVPGKKEKEHFMRDLIAVEPLDKIDLTADSGYSANKIVFMHSERDLKQKLRIRSKELALHPSLEVYSKFLDTHVYIFKKNALDFIDSNQDRAVLKGEMIPLLVSRQFTNQKNVIDNIEDDDVDGVGRNTGVSDYEIELQEKLDLFNPRNVTQSTYFQKSNNFKPNPSCHAIVIKDMPAYRVNTVGSYLDSNKEAKVISNVFGLKNTTSIKECLIGESTTIGEKCVIKKGSIGSNCKIGSKCKLFDCVIMDNVEIGQNTNLTECIVGNNARIGTKCDLKSCIVGYRQTIPDGRKLSSEVEDGHAIDLTDPLVVEDD